MNGQTRSGHAHAHPPAPPTPLIGPRTSYTLSACAALTTAAYLGTPWISHPVLGAPVGLWLLGIGLGITAAQAQRTPARRPARPAPHGGAWDRARSALAGAAFGVSDVARPLVDRLAELTPRLSALYDNPVRRPESLPPRTAREPRRRDRGDGAVRIGIDLPGDDRDAVAELLRTYADEDGIPLQIVPAASGADDNDRAACARAGLDLVVRRSERGGLRLTLPSRRAVEPVWPDWAKPLPLGYPGVFPPRIDPARVDLGDLELGDIPNATLCAQLALCAGLLGAHAAALSPSRWSGASRVRRWDAAWDHRLQRAMLRLAHRVCKSEPGSEDAAATPVVAAAARAVQAWLTMWGGQIDDALRRDLIEGAARHLPGEPESLLRTAAARFACYDDEAGLHALLGSRELLVRNGATCAVDPLAFVLSEIEHGVQGPMTLGRVAAGICLLWSTASSETLEYLRDDLLDDLRYAGWLVGRDQDQRLLREVVRTLDGGVVEPSVPITPQGDEAGEPASAAA